MAQWQIILAHLDVILSFCCDEPSGVFSCFYAEYVPCMYVVVTWQFVMTSVPKSVLQSKDNSEVVFNHPNLDSFFRRLLSWAKVCFGRPCRRLLLDSLYLAQIFCTFFYCSSIKLQLQYLKIPLHLSINLNSIPITNVSTGTYNYNAWTKEMCMRMCKTYVDNMSVWHMSWRSVVSCS